MINMLKNYVTDRDFAKFDRENAYSGEDLGVVYEDGITRFKVWAPHCTAAYLNLYTSGEGDNKVETLCMRKTERGVGYRTARSMSSRESWVFVNERCGGLWIKIGSIAAAEDAGYTVSTGTFTQEDDSVDDNLLAALKNLKEGEVTDLIDGDSSYFVARLDKEVDEDATEETRQSIIEQRKDDLYDETLDGWKEGIEWAVKEKVWDDVNFDNLFTTIKDTETESTTEQATE